MTIGRQIAVFNRHFGILHQGTVVSRPYVLPIKFVYTDDQAVKYLVVDIRNSESGVTEPHCINDMGVVAYEGSGTSHQAWHRSNFTVDVRKKALLPELSEAPDKDIWLGLGEAQLNHVIGTAINR